MRRVCQTAAAFGSSETGFDRWGATDRTGEGRRPRGYRPPVPPGLPRAPWVAGALLLGLVAYGISLALFVVALRHLGTARTGAYFSGHPSSVPRSRRWLGEPFTPGLLVAGALMAVGVWLHLTEQHAHLHAHPAEEHDHEHEHDVHHQHEHAEGHVVERHSHPHRHEPMTHAHAHFPDAHHRHSQ